MFDYVTGTDRLGQKEMIVAMLRATRSEAALGWDPGAVSEVREATTVARLSHHRRGGQAGVMPVR